MAEVEVCSIADLDENGVAQTRTVGGRKLSLVRLGGRIFAIKDVCPHQSASFNGAAARFQVLPGVSFGELDVDEAHPVIQCPIHIWRYSLLDGRCLVDPKLRVKTYGVTVRNSRVFVDLPHETRGTA